MANLIFSNEIDIRIASVLIADGKLFEISKGIYTDTLDYDEITRVLNNKWMEVACYLFDQPIAVARTASTLLPYDNYIYLVSGELKTQTTVEVNHLKFHVSPGNSTDGVQYITKEFKRSDITRYCLENLSPSYGNQSEKRTLGRKWVEAELVKELRKHGTLGLNTIRNEAKILAPILSLENEHAILDSTIMALLKKIPFDGILQTRLGVAQAKGLPFDSNRLDIFEVYRNYLNSFELKSEPYEYNDASWRNLTFFESYFSNYIEGTEFSLSEAESIIFKNNVNKKRYREAHDILSHFNLSGDIEDMSNTPTSSEELINMLKERHKILFIERPDKRPGQLKEIPNKAGRTDFVSPELVEGTLAQGFEIYESLKSGIDRALFMHLLVSECHPFDDGNGRLSRIMMNAELASENQHKIIVPVVHRESYLNGMRTATRATKFRTMTKVMHQLHCYTSTLNWLNYDEAKNTLLANAANKNPDDGISTFNQAISGLGGRYPSG